MRTHLRATAHLYVMAAIVAALLSLATGCRFIAEWGVPAVLATAGAVVAGPVGAGGGAALGVPTGEKIADMVQPPPPPPPTTVNHIKAESGSNVQVGAAHASEPWYAPWLFWGKVAIAVLGLLVAIPRTRPHVLGFLYSVVLGHGKSALEKAGAAIGWVHSAKADATLLAARRRRGAKPPPAVVVSTEQVPHA